MPVVNSGIVDCSVQPARDPSLVDISRDIAIVTAMLIP
jgi:hypothetical protein